VASRVLNEEFKIAEEAFRDGQLPQVPDEIVTACDDLFASNTQAYREALLGCAVVRIVDPDVDVRYPHLDLSPKAFSGRGLDESVINPFLKYQEIPSSNGPYLSALRRAVRLELPVPQGQRDTKAFEALVTVIEALRAADEGTARLYLRYLLCRFLRLREESKITLVRAHRLSLDQYRQLLPCLLSKPSGGRMPLLVAVAGFQTLCRYFELDWEIEWQEINAADAPSKAGGDITVRSDDAILMAVEVTERPIDAGRVRTTFRAKISPHAIDDYLFIFSGVGPNEEAKLAAKRYFAQGHHICFVPVEEWIISIMSLVGPEGRVCFEDCLLELLDREDIPRALKVGWNQCMEAVIAL
jgi:hypothetical protein